MSLFDHYFDRDYALEFEAWGDGEISEKALKISLDEIFAEFAEEIGGYPADISLSITDTLACGYDYGFTSIDTAFLEKLDTLKELVLPDSITDIKMTPKLEKLLKNNGVLIRGTFDSFAEKFAAENGLHFRHRDLFLASYEFAPAHETTTLTLQFLRDGSAQIEENVSSPGSSSSHCFGGTFYHALDREFFLHKSAEDIADRFGKSLHDELIENGRLADFLEKARTHRLYKGKN
ncbi:hypothetical protein [Ruminococcus sp. FC2018]|uniref:hypothetical protein n=1 Tax=Ruminococcus sp. FC2018 TaxID=1410617 RepID=UPI00048D677D|nr:hypothetical protein [Ruminococcus sp. FC2018]